jgi:hypothetical protein
MKANKVLKITFKTPRDAYPKRAYQKVKEFKLDQVIKQLGRLQQ